MKLINPNENAFSRIKIQMEKWKLFICRVHKIDQGRLVAYVNLFQ